MSACVGSRVVIADWRARGVAEKIAWWSAGVVCAARRDSCVRNETRRMVPMHWKKALRLMMRLGNGLDVQAAR